MRAASRPRSFFVPGFSIQPGGLGDPGLWGRMVVFKPATLYRLPYTSYPSNVEFPERGGRRVVPLNISDVNSSALLRLDLLLLDTRIPDRGS